MAQLSQIFYVYFSIVEFLITDQFTGNMKKFFDALGSGSYDEVPEGDEDDEKVEAAAQRSLWLSYHCTY